jgi:hypothetical protein
VAEFPGGRTISCGEHPGGGSSIEDCITVMRPEDELRASIPETPRCQVRSDVLALPYETEPLALSSANGSTHLQGGANVLGISRSPAFCWPRGVEKAGWTPGSRFVVGRPIHVVARPRRGKTSLERAGVSRGCLAEKNPRKSASRPASAAALGYRRQITG